MNGWLTIKTRLINGELKKGLKEMTESFKGGTKQVIELARHFAKIAVIVGAIVGVFKLIQGGIKNLLDRNEELSAKIQGIKNAVSNLVQGLFNAMANLLEPIITKIVDWVYKLLAYLNVVTKEFFNIDLFAKGTNKSLKGSAKSAKEIKKSLAGFDEMNVLSDNSSSGGGGGAGGGTSNFKVPEIDTSKFEEKLETLKDNWHEILEITKEEARDAFLSDKGVWGYFKLGLFWIEQGFVKIFDGVIKIFKGDFKEGFKETLDGMITLGLGAMETIYGAIKGLKDKAFNLFKSAFDTVVDLITSPIKAGIKTAKEAFKNFFKSVKDVISGIGKLFTGDLKGAIDKFKSAFSNLCKGLWSTVKVPLNMIIEGINALIRGLNKISIEIPDWVPTYGGKKFGINIKQIPKLAQGGIVSNPGMGVNMGSYIAGERGAEAVLPLTDDTLQRLANMIPITIDLTNTIDGRTLNRRLETIRMNDSFAGNR